MTDIPCIMSDTQVPSPGPQLPATPSGGLCSLVLGQPMRVESGWAFSQNSMQPRQCLGTETQHGGQDGGRGAKAMGRRASLHPSAGGGGCINRRKKLLREAGGPGAC